MRLRFVSALTYDVYCHRLPATWTLRPTSLLSTDRITDIKADGVFSFCPGDLSRTPSLLLLRLQKELKRPMLIPPSDFGPKFKDTVR